MAKRIKYYSIYPLYILPRQSHIDPLTFYNCILIGRIKENILLTKWKEEEIPYSIIGDGTQNGLVLGRLLRLSKEDVDRIDIDAFKEEVLRNGPSQYVAENSHFVFDSASNLIFCEYNPNGVNALGNRSSEIINNALQKCDYPNPKLLLHPIPSDEMIEAIAGSGMVRRYRLAIPGMSAKHVEDLEGPSSLVNEIAENDTFEFDMTLKLDRHKQISMEKLAQLKSFADKLHRKKAKSFKVYTDEGNFDLIRENLLYYDAEVVQDSRERMRDDLYEQLKEKLEENKDTILQIIGKQQDLDRYS